MQWPLSISNAFLMCTTLLLPLTPQNEVQDLKERLHERPRTANVASVGASSTESDVLAFIDTLVQVGLRGQNLVPCACSFASP